MQEQGYDERGKMGWAFSTILIEDSYWDVHLRFCLDWGH